MSDIQIQPQPVAIARVAIVLAGATFIVSLLAWLLTGGGGEIFENQSNLHSYMPDASGLIVTAPVQLDGIQIGKISEIGLSGIKDPKKVVYVQMKVKTRYLPAIPVDSTVIITADDLLGDKYLNIKIGHEPRSVRAGGELRSVLPIGDQFNSADLIAAMKDMLNRVDASIKQIEDVRTPIGQFVLTDDMYNNILAELVSVQEEVGKFAHPQSDFGKMLFTDELYQRLRDPIIAIDKKLADLQAGEGEAGHLLASNQQYDNIRKQIADMRNSLAEINAGRGAMGQLTQTDATYRQIQRLMNTMDRAVDSLSSGETGLAVFLKDSQLYESLTGSTAEMQRSLADFRTNPRKYLRLKVF
jgi:phospholipid/cholesterol/gamma-HCH transport system substrate-binding protein